MPAIRLKENEPFDVALRRFKRAVEKTGLLTELRAREFYEKPTAERKRKHAAAVKRLRLAGLVNLTFHGQEKLYRARLEALDVMQGDLKGFLKNEAGKG